VRGWARALTQHLRQPSLQTQEEWRLVHERVCAEQRARPGAQAKPTAEGKAGKAVRAAGGHAAPAAKGEKAPKEPKAAPAKK